MPSSFLRTLFPTVVLLATIAGCDLDDEDPSIAQGAAGPVAIILQIDGEIPGFTNPSDFLTPSAMSQYKLEDLLNRASKDIQVQEVVVHFLAPQIGWARAGEIGDAITRFKKSGKPMMCPGICINMHRDSEAMQTIGLFLIDYSVANHIP